MQGDDFGSSQLLHDLQEGKHMKQGHGRHPHQGRLSWTPKYVCSQGKVYKRLIGTHGKLATLAKLGYDGLHLGVVLDGFVTVLGVLVMILRKTMCW
jgi:hypothetical protein